MTLNRIRHGLTASLISQIISFIESLGFVPLFLHAWGSNQYGNWLSLTAFLSYIMLLNLGGQEYIANLATMAYANKDIEGFKRSLSEGVSLFAVICGLAFIGLTLITIIFAMRHPLNVSKFDSMSLIILWLVGTSYLISILGGVFATTYRAVGKYAHGMNMLSTWAVVRIVILAISLLLRISPTMYAFLLVAIVVARTIYGYFDLLHFVPEFREIQLSFQAAVRGRHYLKGSLLFWGIAIAGAINFQGTLLVVAVSSAPAIVVLFSTHRTVSNLLRYPLGLLQGPILPEITRLWAEQDHLRLLKLIRSSILINTTVSGFLATALWVWVPVIYEFWTGRNLKLDPQLLSLLLVQNALYCGWVTTGWLLISTNQHRPIAFCDLLNAGMTIFFAIILAPIWGLKGVVIASIIGDVLFGVIAYPRLLAKTKIISISSLYRLIGSAYLPSLIVGTLVVLLNRQVQGAWYLIIANLVLLAASIVALRLLLNKNQLTWVQQQFGVQYSKLFNR